MNPCWPASLNDAQRTARSANGWKTARGLTLAVLAMLGSLFVDAKLKAQQSGGGSTNPSVDSAAAARESDSDAASAKQAAWEYRPYQVAVWIAHDHSYALQAELPQVMDRLQTRTRLVDPSGWNVTVSSAPDPWNWRIIQGLQPARHVQQLKESLQRDVATSHLDKMIFVRLIEQLGLVNVTVQELDLKTEFWGAEVQRQTTHDALVESMYDGIATAFMPLTRIERVLDKSVKVRVRASGIDYLAEEDADGNWTLEPNMASPVWVGNDEIILPIVLRSNRRGNVESIQPVEWTYLSIVDRDGPHLNCTTHSRNRAPLGGRTGGRTERMGLCVRAPNRPTTLNLISNDSDEMPLADLEIYSREPGMDQGEESEFLDKTDWRGNVEVTPNEAGIRILYVKSGERALARLPVVPGLLPLQTARMPNDEQRLYAEGIIRGLRNKLMDYFAQRQVLQARIERLIEQKKFDEAEQTLSEMRNVADSKKFNVTLSIEEKKLQAADDRQSRYIAVMFSELEELSTQFLNADIEVELSQKIRDATRSEGS